MLKIKFIILSATNLFFMNEKDFFNDENFVVDVKFIKNNKDFISKVYNREIDTDHDFFVFMHGDVKFSCKEVLKKIYEIRNKYDLIGAAGTSFMNLSSNKRINWFSSGIDNFRKTGIGFYGRVKQTTNPTETLFNMNEPDLTEHNAVCLDGLFLVLSKKAVDSGLRFDEDVCEFDFYDTDICFQAITKKLNIGIIILDYIEHGSVGAGLLSNSFMIQQEKFKKKWEKLLQIDNLFKVILSCQ